MGLRQNLRNVRKKRGLSQEQLACMVCVSRQTISKWESGESYPSSFHIVTLAKRLNCDINVLIGNDEIISVEDANSDTSLPKVGLLKSILPRACFTALVGLFVAVLCFFFAGQSYTPSNRISETATDSMKLEVFNTITSVFLDNVIRPSDQKVKRTIVGYGISNENGSFYIKCRLCDNGTPKAAIIYFHKDNNGDFSYDCEFYDDYNYCPQGEFHRIG